MICWVWGEMSRLFLDRRAVLGLDLARPTRELISPAADRDVFFRRAEVVFFLALEVRDLAWPEAGFLVRRLAAEPLAGRFLRVEEAPFWGGLLAAATG
ncbi:MAG: hypothetical protein JRJ59_02890 [Deltaproteobacteria bacterium]|nr:hypothetical protein [Deltaproteobacteria bacterium]